MIHMLSWFDLKEAVSPHDLMAAIGKLTVHMQEQDLLVDCSQLGERVLNTPMDTDDERLEKYFLTMRFRDRAQLDASYDYLLNHSTVAEGAHVRLFSMFKESRFICWEV